MSDLCYLEAYLAFDLEPIVSCNMRSGSTNLIQPKEEARGDSAPSSTGAMNYPERSGM